MSFTSEVKDELARIMPESVLAQRAELAALVRLEGSVGGLSGGRHRVEVTTENAPVARKIITLSHAVYGLKTEFTPRRNTLHKTNNYLITIPSQRGLKKALDEFGLIGGDYPCWGIPHKLIEGEGAAQAYARGAFLAAGFIADPKGDFHFEIGVHSEELAHDIRALLVAFSIDAKVVERRSGYTVYLKGSEPIIDFLALVGAHQALLRAEDVRVYKSVRNNCNRQANAEFANQLKTTEAAIAQIQAIEQIRSRGAFSSLPPALHEFATLRMAHPELSLRELGEQADPPLSKSAVNHRMRRIEAFARSLDETSVS